MFCPVMLSVLNIHLYVERCAFLFNIDLYTLQTPSRHPPDTLQKPMLIYWYIITNNVHFKLSHYFLQDSVVQDIWDGVVLIEIKAD